MDMFEQQEMCKNRPQVTSKLNDWYVPKTIKKKASKAFKTFKNKVVGLYNVVTGQTRPSNPKQIKRMKKKLGKLNNKIKNSKRELNDLISKLDSINKKPKGSRIKQIKPMKELDKLNKKIEHVKKDLNYLISKRDSINEIKLKEAQESFNPIKHEQAFHEAYRSYRINGRPRIDVDTFFDRIRQNLINLINREVKDLSSTTAWIRFRQALEDDLGNIIGYDRVRLAFNSRMTEIFQGSALDEVN